MKNQITSADFLNYLVSLKLFRWSIKENENGFEAIISKDTIPNLLDFTQILKQKDGTYLVRLSNKDFFNFAIAKGFFKQ